MARHSPRHSSRIFHLVVLFRNWTVWSNGMSGKSYAIYCRFTRRCDHKIWIGGGLRLPWHLDVAYSGCFFIRIPPFSSLKASSVSCATFRDSHTLGFYMGSNDLTPDWHAEEQDVTHCCSEIEIYNKCSCLWTVSMGAVMAMSDNTRTYSWKYGCMLRDPILLGSHFLLRIITSLQSWSTEA